MKKPKKDTRSYHKVKRYSEGGAVTDDGYETARQVNAGPKTAKGGDGVDAYPGTDDNMFTAGGRDEKIIRAKRALRQGLK